MPDYDRFFYKAKSAPTPSALDVYGEAVTEIPSATGELLHETWQNPLPRVKHAVTTLMTSAGLGAALGYILPAKGPAGLIAGVAMTVPLVYGGIKHLIDAKNAAQKPGADSDAIAHQLARDFVGGTADFALNFAGGMAGAEAGYALAGSKTAFGSLAQSAQRQIMNVENRLMLSVKNSSLAEAMVQPKVNPKLPRGTITTAEQGVDALAIQAERIQILPEHQPWHRRPLSRLSERINQYETLSQPQMARGMGAAEEYTLVEGSLHIHTKYSDGVGTVTSLGQKAKDGGQQVILFSDHNHLASRDGIKPGDPRIPEQNGIPNIAEAPRWYSESFAEAKELTEPGKFVALVGTEMGTIGKPGTGGHHGGKNHFIMIEMPQFFEAVRRPRTLFESMQNPFRRLFGMRQIAEIKPPEVIKYNDGDMAALISHIRKYNLKDTGGGDPIFIMAHPRWSKDHAPSLPKGTKGADYGRYSFKTKGEWVTETDRHFRMIEVIKGQALNPRPVPEVGAKDIDLLSFRGYLNEGFHVSPTVGRDAHFGNPLGNPAETGILVRQLDKNGVMDAMRQRRTMATTSMARLKGTVTANDRFQMGSILDQAVVPDLKLTARIESPVTPEAQYTFKLWGDKKVGDRTMADVIEETTLSGRELSQSGDQFTFDTVRHTLGNKGAYFVEVVRKDPATGHKDHMYLAPFWIEPLGGGGRHSIWMRWLAGATGNVFTPSFAL